MALITRHNIGDHSFAHVRTPQKSFCLDYHSVLHGQSHRYPSLSDPPKPLKFKVPNIPPVSCVFVSSSKSIGCLFLDPEVTVYCTKPVCDQLLLMHEEYQTVPISYSEDEEATNDAFQIRLITEIDIDAFKKRVILLKYFQQINLNTTIVTAVPAGTHIGWANYTLCFPNRKTLTYLSSYSHKRRFAMEAAPIASDYLLLCRPQMSGHSTLAEFTNFLLRFVPSRGGQPVRWPGISPNQTLNEPTAAPTLVFPVNIPTSFVEIFFHVLSVLEHSSVPIYVISPIFSRLEQLINIQSEWLNRAFCALAEPFPMRQYPALHCFPDFNHHFLDAPKVVFCSAFQYGLFSRHELFPNQIEVLITGNSDRTEPGQAEPLQAGASTQARVSFRVRMESADSEILSNYQGTVLAGDLLLVPSENPNSIVYFNKNLNVIDGLMFVSGTLENTDLVRDSACVLSVREEKCWLSTLIETSEYKIIGEWVVFPKERVKYKCLDNHQIVYRRY